MKTLLNIVRKTVELTPVFALLIIFMLSSIILPPAIKYARLRWQIHNVENEAVVNGHWISGSRWMEDWGGGRSEKYKSLNDKLDELIGTSKVAELCDKYGTPGFSPVRDIPLIIMGIMWILSASWIACTAWAEYEYRRRMYLKRKEKQIVQEESKQIVEGIKKILKELQSPMEEKVS